VGKIVAECEKCGTKYKRGDLFCGKCGAKITEKKHKLAEKKPKKLPSKKQKTELSEDVKRKLKGELEISIKAFKRGDITLEEFQDIKKSIVAKAKAGFYDEPESEEIDVKPQIHSLPEPPLSIENLEPSNSRELLKPVKRKDAPLFSKLWYLAPIIFNIFGGIVAYFALKPVDERSAKKLLAIGTATFILFSGGVGYYLFTEDILGLERGVEAPTEIVIEGAEDEVEDILDLTETVPINATNNTAEEMNLVPDDVGSGFEIDLVLTGLVKDPLEFTGGNSTQAEELDNQGWIENHRIVMKKEIIDAGENKTFPEIEVDSSISKYDVSKLSSVFFESQLELFKTNLIEEGFSQIDFEINESGLLLKKVDEINVAYKIFFYKQDTSVSLSVNKTGRVLEDEDVKGFAQIIEGKIN
jgi:uncharacterized Zn finger protein (UPF0148 family)